MEHLNNPCDVCIKTKNHCCTSDLVLNYADAMLMMRNAKDLGKDVILGWHIDNRPEEIVGNMMMIPNKPGLDPRREPCVFLDASGKCEIYEDRPSICRMYGTQDMRCRYEYAGIDTEAEIAAVDKQKMRELDNMALDKTFGFLAKVVKFVE